MIDQLMLWTGCLFSMSFVGSIHRGEVRLDKLLGKYSPLLHIPYALIYTFIFLIFLKISLL